MSDTLVTPILPDLVIESLDQSVLDAAHQTGYYSAGSTILVTPPQIATAYNIPASTGAGIKVGIISFGGGFLQSDLNSTFSSFHTAGLIPNTVPAPTINKILLNGATGVFSASDGGASGENTLDVYCVATMVPAATINIYISTSSVTLSSANAVWAQAVSDGCDIITSSWSFGEGNGDFLATTLQTASTNNIAVLNASGDYGSEYSVSEAVPYPTSSPYVIGVGGTFLGLNTSTNARLTETYESPTTDALAQSGVGSGGGFSTLFSASSWQTGLQYQTYNSSTHVTGSLTSVSMRGIPDISAPMNQYALYYNGSLTSIGGTSAGTPAMAGMLARFKALTGQALSSYAYNKLFYANPSAFYDITTGNNATAIANGYAARVGWDPVTGMGTPIGMSLLNLIIGNRPVQGQAWPRVFGIRPSKGQTYPRTKMRF